MIASPKESGKVMDRCVFTALRNDNDPSRFFYVNIVDTENFVGLLTWVSKLGKEHAIQGFVGSLTIP